ncbi:uncharacterized protein UMAG_05197 [Mycosarcoma maydis]|uniref:PIG-P domain-containing protein n=1 Tax=Mycosarcoma maydis TaxID=5270 RepID=A0A0D1E6U8_MYCMD|nr:uncharacterized protein UMAG_05197 [Ustilago maydis 521]KIS70125.1 hypothetical protein UMAG_05197 [Ustilago maydis 521]|eukprot:XP_011388239.1 hypothetical protein UMAG_05197 [Ustilago maydis 521]
MSYAGTTPLFAPGPNPRAPALPWRSDDFFAVDDRVRGGTSHSHTAIVQFPPISRGELVFSGFLDTLTLGGAGFASQSSTTCFPVTLNKQDFVGLRLVVRKNPNWQEPTPPYGGANPGGGKAPVTSFVFEIKTEEPERRPDGRRQSVIVWEWSFSIPQLDGQEAHSLNLMQTNDDFWVFDSTWSDFKPMYRGRPVDPDKAGEFRPQDTREWSLMARSNFQAQSGPFVLQLHSLSALPSTDQFAANLHADSSSPVEDMRNHAESWVDKKLDHSFRASFRSHVSTPVTETAPTPSSPRSCAAEYYGFALFIFSTLLWVIWIAWALTPDTVLHSIGIGWYPNREWAFLLPAWSLFAVLAVYAVFIGLNAKSTPELREIVNVTDSAQNVLPISMSDDKHLFEDQHALAKSLHDIYDLPPTYVSRQMHLSQPSPSFGVHHHS